MLIWLDTYAERLQGEGRDAKNARFTAKILHGVPGNPANCPESNNHDPTICEITVVDGRLGPVGPEVREFEVSGLKVVRSWLGYRMKKRGLRSKIRGSRRRAGFSPIPAKRFTVNDLQTMIAVG